MAPSKKTYATEPLWLSTKGSTNCLGIATVSSAPQAPQRPIESGYLPVLDDVQRLLEELAHRVVLSRVHELLGAACSEEREDRGAQRQIKWGGREGYLA